MLTPSIDRTLLSLAAAVDWLLSTLPPAVPAAPPTQSPWLRSSGPTPRDLAVREALLVLLRDGDLHAVGRYSDTPAAAWEVPHDGRRWVMHSGRPSHITPEQWRGGTYHWLQSALTLPDGQFIDIRVPRFMIQAIWPEPTPTVPPNASDDPTIYTTPYLELMEQAIRAHGLTAERQIKKEVLVEWFRAQQVNGAPVSENLANCLATFVRLPESQRGGNRKWRSGE